MGTIKKGILGGVSGKVGNVVGSSWKGIDYIKSLPSGGSRKMSELQIKNCEKFKVVMQFLKPITQFVEIGFKVKAKKQTGVNAAMSYTYHNALTGEYPDIGIDFSKVVVSRGQLMPAHAPTVEASEANKVNLSWTNLPLLPGATLSDQAMAVIYHKELKEACCVYNAGNREDETCAIDIPANYSGGTLHAYICFASFNSVLNGNNKNIVSESLYAGSVTAL